MVYTAEELVELASLNGLTATARLIRDWVSLGLLDRPRKRGLGRGKGTIATWGQNQATLFLALLRQRRDNTSSVHALCNLPVSLWLYSGDDYAPLSQVRRALATWSPRARSSSYNRALAAASEVVERFANPGAPAEAKRHLRDAIADIQAGVELDSSSLLRKAERVIDPAVAPKGPDEAPISAQHYVRHVERMDRVIAGLSAVTNAQFETARRLCREARVDDGRTLDEALNHASQDLVFCLGLVTDTTVDGST